MAKPNEIVRCGRVRHGTEAYAATVALRQAVLREPLGLRFDEQELLAESDSVHLVCRRNGRIVACVIAKPLKNGQVRLRQMAVAAALQRRGLGRRLVTYAEAFLRRQGYREILLHARETAAGFYEALGYARGGERFTEVGIPHFAMRKRL